MEKYTLREDSRQTDQERDYKAQMEGHFNHSAGSILDKLNNFQRFVPRQSLSLFLAKNELFKHIVDVHGSIVECGVYMGGGLFSWANFSAIYEPVNHNRKVIGFDTFQGFPSIGDKDGAGESTIHKKGGGYRFEHLDELSESVRLFDLNRALGHIPKIELIEGDACHTIPGYLEDNPHLVVSLLYLDFDLYEPTLVALREFVPRMPKGAVIAFDELNQKEWPGETIALLESVGIRNLRIKRFPFTPALSYAVIE